MSRLTDVSKTYKPFRYPWAMEKAVAHEKMHWGEWEARLHEDLVQWNTGKLTAGEKAHITSILRLFTQSDMEVGRNYLQVFVPYFKNNEVRAMLTSYAAREFVHQRAYALLNDTLGLPEQEYSAFLEEPVLSEKVSFMQADEALTSHDIALSLAQTVCNEGMSLFSAFIMLLGYQRTGKMKGTCEIVEWSIRDENTHVDGMLQLFHTHLEENPEIVTDYFKKRVYDMFRTAVELEDQVIDLAYQDGGPSDLEKEDVKRYVRYLADRRLLQLGMKPNFGVKDNPLPWVDWVISGDSFKNFFEGVVTDYSTAGLIGTWEY